MRKPPAFYTSVLAFGDCICTTPTVRKLSEVYGEKVTVYSHFPEIYAPLPYVAESHDVKDWISLEKSTELRNRFDVHYSFWTLGKKMKLSDDRGVEFKHAVMDIRQYHAIDNGFNLRKDELQCDFIPHGERKKFDLPQKYVCLHPFKNWPSRTWDQKNWEELISLLNESQIPTVIIGKDDLFNDKIKDYLAKGVIGKTDERLFEEIEGRKTVSIENDSIIDLTNQTNLSEAWEIINGAACVATMDSGILHLAGTTDTWIVQLGSSIHPEFRAPYRLGRQDYKYTYVAGGCNLFCASNMKYYLRDWEVGYNGGTPIQSVPLIDSCLEKKEKFECHPDAKSVFEAIKKSYDSYDLSFKYVLPYVKAQGENTFTSDLEESFLIKIQSASLGDTIGALSAIDSFSGGKPVDVIANFGKENFGKSYPHINFHPHNSEPEFDSASGIYSMNGKHYSTFKRIYYKFDKPLIDGYAEQLNVTSWNRPKIDVEEKDRPIKGKYVCFSMHSTAQCKHWNYPDGWEILCKLLRKEGITPVCIDRYESYGVKENFNPVPKSSVKKQGMSLKEMTNYIKHAECFIGLGSGLSWVAHAIGKPVVMIAGMSSEDHEFTEDILKIVNKKVCHGCFNKPDKYPFNPSDWFWCPVHKGSSRQFECTTSISPEYVLRQVMSWMEKNYATMQIEEFPDPEIVETANEVEFMPDWKEMKLHILGESQDARRYTVTFLDVAKNEKVYSENIGVGYWIGVDPRDTQWKIEIEHEGTIIKTFESPK
jgi:autotransporter strand-loop-strand O-heptosyltransferase